MVQTRDLSALMDYSVLFAYWSVWTKWTCLSVCLSVW